MSESAAGKGRDKLIAGAIVLTIAIAVVLYTVVSPLFRSKAEKVCREQLEQELGADGVVSVKNVEETSSGALTKVEGDLVWREQRGAGDRHDTWFVCQVEGGDVSELTVK